MPRTGFLTDYDSLAPAPERQVWGVPDPIDLELAPGGVAGRYDSVWIDPVVYREVEGAGHHPTEANARKLERDFTRILTKVLGERFRVVDAPGPRTARVRAAITEVDPERPWVNVLTLILLVPTDMGGISGEFEIVDSISGERQVALTAVREGTPFLVLECFTRYGHAKHGMKKWAKELRSILAGQ